MRLTRKGHTHLKVIAGGKPRAPDEASFIRLREEQTKTDPARPLTPAEIEALHSLDRDRT